MPPKGFILRGGSAKEQLIDVARRTKFGHHRTGERLRRLLNEAERLQMHAPHFNWDSAQKDLMKIVSPRLAFLRLQTLLHAEVEEFWAIALSSEKEVLQIRLLFRGTVDHCEIHPRDVFRFALLTNASSLVIAHNHPTGRAKPSKQDFQVTQRLLAAAELLQIPIEDHLILAKKGNSFYSFLQAGKLIGPGAPGDQ